MHNRSSMMVVMNKLSTNKRCQVASALVEGCSIRSADRMTGVAKKRANLAASVYQLARVQGSVELTTSAASVGSLRFLSICGTLFPPAPHIDSLFFGRHTGVLVPS
jgi:hypothetical protein